MLINICLNLYTVDICIVCVFVRWSGAVGGGNGGGGGSAYPCKKDRPPLLRSGDGAVGFLLHVAVCLFDLDQKRVENVGY